MPPPTLIELQGNKGGGARGIMVMLACWRVLQIAGERILSHLDRENWVTGVVYSRIFKGSLKEGVHCLFFRRGGVRN